MSYNQGSWSQQEQQPSASSSGCESVSELTNSSSIKKRVTWTIDLHDKFVECVNHLGGPMSMMISSSIYLYMNVCGFR